MSTRRRKHEDWAPSGASGIARWMGGQNDAGEPIEKRHSARCPSCHCTFTCYALDEVHARDQAEDAMRRHIAERHPEAVPA